MFFAPVHRSAAWVAGWLRVVYAGVFSVAIASLARVVGLVSQGSSVASTPEALAAQVTAALDRFTAVWDAGLILFGFHLLVVGWLAYRSGYVPRWLSVLVAIAGVGYVVDSLGALVTFLPSTSASTVTFVGELLLALWLLVRSRRVILETSGRPVGPLAAFEHSPEETDVSVAEQRV